MKELSIEEKAKAYDEAKLRMSAAYNSNRCTIGFMNEIFPELRESEDERIRKELLNAFQESEDSLYMVLTPHRRESFIAWLKKQGKHDMGISEAVKQKLEDNLNKALEKETPESCNKFLEMQGEQKDILEDAILDSNEDGLIAETIRYKKEKQDEQKPADKVEPKFKVGDYVVDEDDNCAYQIECVMENVPSGEFSYDLVGGGYFPSTKKNYHLWTIQDAKDGDVLHSIGWHNDCIFIFNGLDNWKFDEPNGDRAVATGYCCLSVSADKMEFGIQGPDCIEVNTVKPATKIQRDLLFQKMKEVGYGWSDKDRKLIKIVNEQKPADKQFTPEQASVLNKHIDKFLKQKNAWSEEDEKMYNVVHDLAWESYKTSRRLGIPTFGIINDWLKSLKDRYTWKPSDEQMEALNYVVNLMASSKRPTENDLYYNILKSLRQQLKKLREK